MLSAVITALVLGVPSAHLSDETELVAPVIQALAADVLSASYARGPTVDLVVWCDNRRSSSEAGALIGPDVYATRLNHQGRVLDAPGIVVSRAARTQGNPEVAFDGVNFLVAWTDSRDSLHTQIYGARISTDGTLLDPEGFAISPGPDASFFDGSVLVASNGTVSWVVWQHDANGATGRDLFGTRISHDGAVLDTPPVTISVAAKDQWPTSLVAAHGGFIVVWDDERNSQASTESDIYLARLSADGRVLDRDGIAVRAAQRTIEGFGRVHRRNDDVLFSWVDDRSFRYHLRTYVSRLSPTGTLLDDAGVWVGDPSIFAGEQKSIEVGTDGTTVWAVWPVQSNTSSLDGARLGAQLEPLDNRPLALFEKDLDKTLWLFDFNGTAFVPMWSEFNGFTQLMSAQIGGDGGVLSPKAPVALAANAMFEPQVCAGNDGGLVVWRDTSSAPLVSGLKAVAVDSDGHARGTPVDLPFGDLWTSTDANTRIAWNGSSYLVVRVQLTSVWALRVDADGRPLDTQAIFIGSGLNPSVASDGSNFFVAWEDRSEYDIAARVVQADGTMGARFAVSNGEYHSSRSTPSVAFDGTNYLVAWSDERLSRDEPNVFAARVSSAEAVLDTSGFQVVPSARGQLWPNVVSDGRGHSLVSWVDGYGFDGLLGARIAANGTVYDPTGFVVEPVAPGKPNGAFDGVNFILTWHSSRNDYAPSRAIRIGLNGKPVEPRSFTVWGEAGDLPTYPAVARLGPEKTMVVYSRFDATPAFNVRRVRARVITPGPDVPEVDAGSLDSGVLVDAGLDDGGQPGLDAGAKDAGSVVIDAGSKNDGGPSMPDAGTAVGDAGPLTGDAGSPSSDAADGGSGPPPEHEAKSECGCRSTSGFDGVALTFFGLGLLFWQRRRRAVRA